MMTRSVHDGDADGPLADYELLYCNEFAVNVADLNRIYVNHVQIMS